MKNTDIKKLVSNILKTTKFQLADEYGFTNSEINNLIKKSRLEKSIKNRPSVYGHMSPEQVIDVVLQ